VRLRGIVAGIGVRYYYRTKRGFVSRFSFLVSRSLT
jgi:histone acetyltransferase (RNA polymerase elongator complex component)